eukprot:tig00000076_g2447.t1
MSSSSTSRAEKRARVDELAATLPAAAVGAPAAAAAMSTLDALPDAVASGVFKTLGPGVSWPLRSVCRRWRQVIEETEWPSFELRTDEENSAGSAPSRHDAAMALVKKRKMRLGDGASVSLGAGWREVEAACGLLAALVRGGGGGGSGAAPAQPREVAFRVLASEKGAEEDGYGEDFLSRFVLGALRALRPPGGAPSRLEGLHFCLWNGVYAYMRRNPLALPPGNELRAALSPFGKLRSLTLYFQAVQKGVTPEAAAAVAAACPLLRSLSFRPDFDSESAALAALAPLAHLERLALLFDRGVLVDASGGGFRAIADGAAGRSLRTLFFLDEGAVQRSDAFPRLSDVVAPQSVDFDFVYLPEAAVRAVLRLPRLERLEPLRFNLGNWSPETVRALGGAACLRELFLHVDDGRAAATAARSALAGALSALPSLSVLRIVLHATSTSPGEVAALLSSAQRALSDLDLTLLRPLSEAEAEAIAALPALRRLRVAPVLDSMSSTALRFYEILARLDPKIDTCTVVAMSGIAGEGLEYPEARGGQADLVELQAILNAAPQPIARKEQMERTRWGVFAAAQLAAHEGAVRGSEAAAPRLDDSASVELSDAALRAVARLPRLERLEPLRFSLEHVSPGAVRALGGAACLRELHLRLLDGRAAGAAASALTALSEAIAALPSLSRLRIELHARSTGPGEVAALLSSACARRSLVELDFIGPAGRRRRPAAADDDPTCHGDGDVDGRRAGGPAAGPARGTPAIPVTCSRPFPCLRPFLGSLLASSVSSAPAAFPSADLSIDPGLSACHCLWGTSAAVFGAGCQYFAR